MQSIKSFATLSSADATSVYNVAQAVPIHCSSSVAAQSPHPSLIGVEVGETEVPPSPLDQATAEAAMHTPRSLAPSTSTTVPPTPLTPHTFAAFPLPPTLPATRYIPPVPARAMSTVSGKRKSTQLLHQSRADLTPPLSSFDGKLVGHTRRGSRLLKGPLSPMSWIGTQEEIQEERHASAGSAGSSNGNASGSGKENSQPPFREMKRYILTDNPMPTYSPLGGPPPTEGSRARFDHLPEGSRPTGYDV